MREGNSPIMTNVSMTADAASSPVTMEQEYMCDIQAVWTGSPVGNFTIETSNDVGQINPDDGSVTGLSHWDTYPSSTQAAGGSANSFTWHVNVLPSKWVRLKYTFTSGTGTVNARVNVKGV